MAVQTSGFGHRHSPTSGASSNHQGCDYRAPIGSPIVANGDLTIEKAGVGSGYGNVVYARDANGTQYRFGHLDGFPPGMKAGDKIKAGDTIGYTGNTGISTGPHLHYEARPNGGAAVDPNSIDPKTGKPYMAAAGFEAGKSLKDSTPTPTKDRKPNEPGTAKPMGAPPATGDKPGPGNKAKPGTGNQGDRGGAGKPPAPGRGSSAGNAVGILVNPRHKAHDGT